MTVFDGTGRPPRPAQVTALNWLQNSTKKVKVVQAPPGTGKSAIARAIQLQTGAAIVVPSNPLLDQYSDTYHDVNFLKGRSHYECGSSGMTCEDRRELKEKPCEGCPYKASRKAALNSEPTVFNPISMFYATEADKWRGYKTVVVDECHKLVDTLHLLSSIEFRKGRYGFEGVKDASTAIAWLKGLLPNLSKLSAEYRKTGDFKKHLELQGQIKRIESIVYGLEHFSSEYVVYTETRKFRGQEDLYLVIKPLRLPPYLMKQLLGDFDELILMSATIPRSWVSEIVGNEPFDYLDLPSPIPVENRPIYVEQTGLTAQSKPEEIAAWIRKHWKGENCIVHVSYSMAQRLQKFFPEALVHDTSKGSKSNTLKKFKKQGGLWLAAGCAEGIDLPGDFARLNLIPHVQFANVGDPYVKAKKQRDRHWYSVSALVTTIQQAGRTTRGVDDWSKTVIGDLRLMQLISRYRRETPQSFIDALKIWEG